ncbi:MAG: acylphosphatase [Candidatus Bathyarchaeia archaeon]|nr:acylphosphatase [Candidatus Bathyarchaeia archaeon]
MAEARIVVDGVVQGVGYGALVRQVARQLSLKGLLETWKIQRLKFSVGVHVIR